MPQLTTKISTIKTELKIMNFEVVVLILKFFILFQSKSLTVTNALSRANRITQKIAMMEIRQPFFFR
jgi:hypothetical protein